MKKWMSVILAILMAVGCAGGLAEDLTEGSGSTEFLMIREDTAASVYQAITDGTASDTLAGGRLCILLEETAGEGQAWYHVFYVNSEKKGATGFIHAEDAEPLRQSELLVLMQDPDKTNEIADLISALNRYLLERNTSDSSSDSSTTGAGRSDRLSGIYDKVMKAVKQVFETDLPAGLNRAADMGREIGGRILETGRDVLNAAAGSAAEGAERLAGSVQNLVEDVKSGAAMDRVQGLIGQVSDSVASVTGNLGELGENIKTGVYDTVEGLDSSLGAEGALESLGNLMENARTFLTTDAPQMLQDLPQKIEDAYSESGLRERVNNAIQAISDFFGTTGE